MTDGETLNQQVMRGEYEVRLLLARSPDTRPLVNQVGDAYVTDALGILQTVDGQTHHRWVIDWDSPEAAAEFRPAIATAATLMPDMAETPSVTQAGSSILIEW
jgi:hypothetical protein